ncbi:hypothetical protein P7C70_g3081, partial [Phenoliferia sp. Uapishka_3]
MPAGQEKYLLLSNKAPHRPALPSSKLRALLAVVLTLALLFSAWHQLAPARPSDTLAEFQRCSITGYDKSALAGAVPIHEGEFLERRDRFARALKSDGHDAFIVEPGFTFVYLANISSVRFAQLFFERPTDFEMPSISSSGKSPEDPSIIIAHTTFLVPAFELQRALDLKMPSPTPEVQYITWEEHISPYAVARAFLGDKTSLVADDEMRAFILDGFTAAGFILTPLIDSPEISAVKSIKSPAEIEIVRAVNTLTIEGIRTVQRCAYFGLTELEISQTLDKTMESAGMEPFFDLALIILPIGQIQLGAHLYGLSSDVCRTFLLPHDPARFQKSMSDDMKRKFEIWHTVLEAQTASITKMVDGGPASQVDLAARGVIEKAGYGKAFTHRLGHGIGIKAHESPYLNKGNTRTFLRTGTAMTSEPGIYLPGDFGVRHEDIVLITENGTEILSGKRATSPWEP